ncbi:MAG: 6,7-dimethyl-8-ribityllumazine synthase [Planctomycetota bacterium]
MGTTFEGRYAAAGRRFAIVAARFNEAVTERLLAGAKDEFRRHGAGEDALDVAWVPGAFEISAVAKALASSGRYAAVVALGSVIRGQTPHFDYIAGETVRGIRAASEATGVPIALGVLTCNAMEEAVDRAGGKQGNKGAEAARTALEMADLLERIRGGTKTKGA